MLCSLKGHFLEYIDETHTYLVDGVQVPSITQIMQVRFGDKYKHVSSEVLNKAAEYGTSVHKVIEDFVLLGKENPDSLELYNFRVLMNAFDFRPINAEMPLILFDKNGEPIGAGRCDLLLEHEKGYLALGDIKAVRTLDTDYLFYQLNLYRIAYQQTYGDRIGELIGLKLKHDRRQLREIPINEEIALKIYDEYKEKLEHEQS